MPFDDFIPFRQCCPKLHEFNFRVHRSCDNSLSLTKLHAWIAQFVSDCASAEKQEKARQKRRRKYLLLDAFKPGNEHVRDETTRLNNCQWEHFDSRVDSGLTDVYPDGVPEAVRDANFYVWRPNPENARELIRTPAKCFDEKTGAVMVSAWTPLPIAAKEPDSDLVPQAPLPPRQLGRQYTIPEICWAVVALHDADGGFEPFVQYDHALYTTTWWMEQASLRRRVDGGSHSQRAANDTWLLSLEALWDRLTPALGSSLGKTPKAKKSTVNGSAKTKIVAALTAHHKYDNGSCLEYAPVQVKRFAKRLQVSPSTVSLHFKKAFGGYDNYVNACRVGDRLSQSLMILNGDVSPKVLFCKLGDRDRDLAQ